MDITRGSRRARHVAATHGNTSTSANANANANNTHAHANAASSPRPQTSEIASSPVPQLAATPSGPAVRSRLNPSQGASPVAAPMITPDGPPLHPTPNQPPEQQRRRRAPPPNPFRLYRSTQVAQGPRLSMPQLDYDGSSSEPEPDDSILHGRARPMPAQAAAIVTGAETSFNGTPAAADEEDSEADQPSGSPEEYEDENLSIEEEDADEDEDEDEEDDVDEEHVQDIAPLFDPATAGLKEVSNLARFTVSSHKPGNGVEELKSDDLKQFWQSDGPQPHKLTMYFTKRVGIRDIRFYVDYNEDESYTPTKVVFKAGTSENNLIEFATMAMENPVGWQQVPIAGAGGDPDGNTLVAWVVQMQILENHQNGKDTHLRGIKIYSFDNDSALGPGRDGNPVDDIVGLLDNAIGRADAGVTRTRMSNFGTAHFEPGEGGLSIPEFMREPEIR